MAEKIIGELLPSASSIEWSRAIDDVKARIEKLRMSVSAADARPRPHAAKRTIEQVVNHARELAACIDQLSPDWRSYLSLAVFHERRADGVVVVGAEGAAEAKMEEWISDLKKIPDNFGNSKPDLFWKSKTLCAFAARDLIGAWSPATKLTNWEGSKFLKIASWLWAAATGELDADLRRACGGLVDLLRKIERDARSP